VRFALKAVVAGLGQHPFERFHQSIALEPFIPFAAIPPSGPGSGLHNRFEAQSTQIISVHSNPDPKIYTHTVRYFFQYRNNRSRRKMHFTWLSSPSSRLWQLIPSVDPILRDDPAMCWMPGMPNSTGGSYKDALLHAPILSNRGNEELADKICQRFDIKHPSAPDQPKVQSAMSAASMSHFCDAYDRSWFDETNLDVLPTRLTTSPKGAVQSFGDALVPAGVAWSDDVGVANAITNGGTGLATSSDKRDLAEGVPEIPDTCDARQRLLAVTTQPPCSSVPRLQSPPRHVPYAPVQAGTWFIASFVHVAFELSPRSWVEQCSAYGVFAAHCSKLDVSLDAEPISCRVVKLLFKSKAAAAIFISLLINNTKSSLTLESFTVLYDENWKITTPYDRVHWLPYVDQLYEHALDPDDFTFLLSRAPLHPHVSAIDFRWTFLGQKGPNDLHTVPLTSAAAEQLCPPRDTRRRKLDCVDFDCEWLIAHMVAERRSFDDAEWRQLCYLAMMLRGHSYGGLPKRFTQFVVGMWPTKDGIIDRVIRIIARWSSTEFGRSHVMKRDETFGALGKGRYRIELELRLDRGRYLVDTRIPFDSINYSLL
jgi:hypothetical protein